MSSGAICIDIAPLKEQMGINTDCIPEKYEDRAGNCYQLSGRFIFDNPDWILVHCVLYPTAGPYKDKPFSHAFVEKDGIVFDPVFNKFYVKPSYYNRHRVTNVHRYTSDEACKLMLKTKHFGEWE